MDSKMPLDHSTRGPPIIIASVIFTVFSVIAVGARLVARMLLLKNAGRDEVAIVGAVLLSIGTLVTTILQVQHGMGRHIAVINRQDFPYIRKYLWMGFLLYTGSMTLTKIAIVSQYMRVFIGTAMRRACWAALALVVTYFLTAFFLGVFSCVPVEAFWNTDPTAFCINFDFLWSFNVGCNMFTDIVILLIPMPVLSSLKLPRKQKICLIMLFGLGGVVCFVSVVRVYSLYKLSRSHDFSWDNVEAATWSVVEMNTAIVCASLPAIRPVVSRLFPRLLSSNRSRTQPDSTLHPLGRNRDTYQLGSRHTKDDTSKRLDVLTPPGKTVTRVEAASYTAGARGAKGSGHDSPPLDKGVSKENIFVTTEMTQDVESKSKTGSQEDLIFQRN